MDLQALKTELATDPLNLGYAGLSDPHEKAAKLNETPAAAEPGRQRDRTTLEAWEVFEATVKSEYAALSADDKELYRAMLSMGTINVRGANTRATFAGLFQAGTQTRANLVALQTQPVSRARFLGFGLVRADDVLRAEAL